MHRKRPTLNTLHQLALGLVAAVGILSIIATTGGDGDDVIIAPEPPSAPQAGVCNGLPGMCDMRFDEVVFPGNHNAGSNRHLITCRTRGLVPDCSWRNQGHNITDALEYGIRYFDIDSVICNGILCTSHGRYWGELAIGPTISDMLNEFDTFLHKPENRNEVIVITFGDGGDNPDVQIPLAEELWNRWTPWPIRLERGDLTIYQKPPTNDPWPTLGELVEANQRIVVFVRGVSDLLKEAGALSERDYIHDTWRSRGCTSSCAGVVNDTYSECSSAPADKLVLVTVNCSSGLCLVDLAGLCNRHIEASLMSCRQARGNHPGPNFVSADWTNEKGDIVADVRKLNEMIIKKKKGIPVEYWAWTTDGLPPAECDDLISGIQCRGSYCDDVGIRCAGTGTNMGQYAVWTTWFSEEGNSERVCPNLYPDQPYVTGVKCKDDYCDSMSLQCNALQNGTKSNDCYWTTDTISEENGGLYEFPPSTYLSGMRCEGSYCDNLRLYLCKVPTDGNL